MEVFPARDKTDAIRRTSCGQLIGSGVLPDFCCRHQTQNTMFGNGIIPAMMRRIIPKFVVGWIWIINTGSPSPEDILVHRPKKGNTTSQQCRRHWLCEQHTDKRLTRRFPFSLLVDYEILSRAWPRSWIWDPKYVGLTGANFQIWQHYTPHNESKSSEPDSYCRTNEAVRKLKKDDIASSEKCPYSQSQDDDNPVTSVGYGTGQWVRKGKIVTSIVRQLSSSPSPSSVRRLQEMPDSSGESIPVQQTTNEPNNLQLSG